MRGKAKKSNFITRLVSILAALAMVVTLVGVTGVPAKAEGETEGNGGSYTITVNNAQPGQTYTLYKLFNATVNSNRAAQSDSGSDSEVMTKGISYTLLDANHSLTNTAGGSMGTTWFHLEADNVVVANDDVNVTTAAFRAWAIAYGQQVTSKTVSGSTATTLTFNNLTNGYYFITSTVGSLVTVTSIAPNAIVKDKNTAPDVKKTESVKTSSVGDTVTYTIEISLPANSRSVVFHDRIYDGLTLADNLTSLTVDSATGTALTVDTDYTVDYWNNTKSTTTGKTNGDNITISFTESYLNGLKEQKTLYLVYNATLNANAGANMPNEAYVTYGDNNTESTHKTVYESTFGFKINKIDADNQNQALNGAKFALSTKGNLTNLTEESTSTDLLSFDSTGTLTTSGGSKVREANNSLIFKGLNNDENNTTQIIYYLYEVKAPDGYYKLTGPIAIKIDPIFNSTEPTKVDRYTVSYKLPGAQDYVTISEYEVGHVHEFNVANSQSIVLPSTGGIGTMIFYIVGGALVVLAVVLLVTRRRKRA